MVASPLSDIRSPDFSPADGDPIRTKEYLQALAEFRARRSLGPNISLGLDKTLDRTPEQNSKSSRKHEEQKSKSDQKPKRRSLPETGNSTHLLSQTLPQIQFLFNNQIFMPGSGLQNRKKGKKNGAKDKKEREQSISLDSNYGKGRQIDFDFIDDFEGPPSPPQDFFRDNSLPYTDKDITTHVGKDLSSEEDGTSPSHRHSSGVNRNSTHIDEPLRPLLDSSTRSGRRSLDSCSDSTEEGIRAKKLRNETEDSANSSRNEKDSNRSVETSFVTVARKLEKTCRDQEQSKSVGHFRGVPLVRQSTLGLSGRRGGATTSALWSGAPVTIRGSAEGEYAARDIHILSTIRHPNILLLMGISYDIDHKVQYIFEECTATLHDYIHNQGPILSYLCIVRYLGDVASAISHLNSNGYVHTAISSHTIMITSRDVAKLCGFELCSRILNMDSDNSESERDTKCDPYKLMYSSPEPEYVNIEGISKVEQRSDEEPLLSSQYRQDCTAQCVSERKLLANYRWQAPELFDEVDGQVYPSKTSDVYSLCLVLWECCNGAAPWKSLSYRQLSDVYLLWQTGIRLTMERYPELIFNILKDGLNINANERISISSLCKKFLIAKKHLYALDESPIRNVSSNDRKSPSLETPSKYVSTSTHFARGSESEPERDVELASVVLKNVLKYQVTDIDNVDDKNNNSSTVQFYPEHHNTESKSVCLNMSPLRITEGDSDSAEEMSHSMAMHNTDSTEYCSLLTPDIRRFASRFQNPNNSSKASKLIFKDESISNIPENTLPEKISRLNSSFTPKSYKSLHIKTPSMEKFENITSLTGSVGSNDKTKSKYSFDIQNTSLPNTPIARNTKIRKYAWLSGEDDDLEYNVTSNISDRKDKSSNISNTDEGKIEPTITSGNVKCSVLSNETTTEIDNSASRVSVENVKNITVCGGTGSLFADRNSFQRASIAGCKLSNQDFGDKFRARSQSWGSRPPSKPVSEDPPITGVDIRPLVAIHEKWIQEANQKQNRSLSLPDNYRGSQHAVKPASHRLDPVLPSTVPSKSPTMLSIKKWKAVQQPNVSVAFCKAATRKVIGNSKPVEFYENSLWKKEKEKCLLISRDENNPQGCSTPYKSKTNSEPNRTAVTDQSTNTETFDELCEIISKQMRMQDFCNVSIRSSKSNNPIFKTHTNETYSEMSPKGNHLFEKEKTYLMNQLCDVFDNNSHKGRSLGNNDVNVTVTLDKDMPKGTSVKNVDTAECAMDSKMYFECSGIVGELMLDDADISNHDEDSLSLPEMKSNDIINKALKRCQAFSALQSARSTEDMYIDDELSVNNDLHALSDHMQLVPIHGSTHEALCDKAKECCLVKLKEETCNDRILIICDNSNRNIDNRPRSSNSDYSEEEERLISVNSNTYHHFPNLQIENLPSMDLIDYTSLNKGLPVIEEIPNEEDLPDPIEPIRNVRKIQDLISIYEGGNPNKTKPNYKEDRSNEISFLILDDNVECDVHPDECELQNNDKINNSDSVIQDYITI